MERLSIGDLARATGLTVRALRHYQDLGLLAPAGVDPVTRYRAYGPEQLERALAIARLRRLGLPLARIRDYLAAPPAEQLRLLEEHRADLEVRLRSTGRLVMELDQFLAPRHERLNLGFDQAGPDGMLPAHWDGGGRVRYRGWLRTNKVRSGWAGLWLRVDGADREVLAFDNLGQVPPDRSLKGTNDWTQAEIVLPVPAEAVALAFGVLLVGDGVLWADDLSFEALPA